MPGTEHILPPVLTRTVHRRYYFPIVWMKKLRIKNVKLIAQGHEVAKAGHLSDAEARVLSVTPCAFQWIRNNAWYSFVSLILNIFFKVCPFSVLHFSCT